MLTNITSPAYYVDKDDGIEVWLKDYTSIKIKVMFYLTECDLSYPIPSHPTSSHLIPPHLISSHLISSHLFSSLLFSSLLISSHLISSHLISSFLSVLCFYFQTYHCFCFKRLQVMVCVCYWLNTSLKQG